MLYLLPSKARYGLLIKKLTPFLRTIQSLLTSAGLLEPPAGIHHVICAQETKNNQFSYNNLYHIRYFEVNRKIQRKITQERAFYTPATRKTEDIEKNKKRGFSTFVLSAKICPKKGRPVQKIMYRTSEKERLARVFAKWQLLS